MKNTSDPLAHTKVHLDSVSSSNLLTQILTLSDLPELLNFEEGLVPSDTPPFELWNQRWRKESLEYYLPLGWSFAIKENSSNKLLGYYLAQPLVFWQGYTQNLWIEHIRFLSDNIFEELLSVARGVAKEKHLQRLILENPASTQLKGFFSLKDSHRLVELATTRLVQ